ncbi:hypothetical protein BT96DRAFT_1017032 [Gymnopus androsaceus JB14]|uniref:Uncharacterized protein n=1 Tax=Gymnopus androsaceus JB14 TaxID=1447944 RepID=A0A6A4HZ60_9AGAR|nr:hypothetical protein BT96DRAFT_1017032 [Gymnopus androsaceus JB14]
MQSVGLKDFTTLFGKTLTIQASDVKLIGQDEWHPPHGVGEMTYEGQSAIIKTVNADTIYAITEAKALQKLGRFVVSGTVKGWPSAEKDSAVIIMKPGVLGNNGQSYDNARMKKGIMWEHENGDRVYELMRKRVVDLLSLLTRPKSSALHGGNAYIVLDSNNKPTALDFVDYGFPLLGVTKSKVTEAKVNEFFKLQIPSAVKIPYQPRDWSNISLAPIASLIAGFCNIM